MKISIVLAVLFFGLGVACASPQPIPEPPTPTAVTSIALLFPNGGEVFEKSGMLTVRWSAGEPGVQRIYLTSVDAGCKIDKVGVNPLWGDMALGDNSGCSHIVLYSDIVYGYLPNTSGEFSYNLSGIDFMLDAGQYYVFIVVGDWIAFDVSDSPITIK